MRRLAPRRQRVVDPARIPDAPPPIELSNRQSSIRLGRNRIELAVQAALALKPRRTGAVSIALVGDRAIRRLHFDHMGEDSATDVLSFPFAGAGGLLGEVVASADTAMREARARGVRPADELLLYVVHGVLHLLGFDDHAPAEQKKMRAAERRALEAVGIARDLFRSRG
ncbi:MAG: rRNA maturation RNase YbeY [Planctomycetes bacterium]|nr:rRNA maturation RNase YbeY [Planctomycetota bacterium]